MCEGTSRHVDHHVCAEDHLVQGLCNIGLGVKEVREQFQHAVATEILLQTVTRRAAEVVNKACDRHASLRPLAVTRAGREAPQCWAFRYVQTKMLPGSGSLHKARLMSSLKRAKENEDHSMNWMKAENTSKSSFGCFSS